MVFLWIPWFSWLRQPPPKPTPAAPRCARARSWCGHWTPRRRWGRWAISCLSASSGDAWWEKARKTNPEKPEGIDCWLRFHEYFMNISWIFHEYFMNSSWIFHEYSMNIPWIFHELTSPEKDRKKTCLAVDAWSHWSPLAHAPVPTSVSWTCSRSVLRGISCENHLEMVI